MHSQRPKVLTAVVFGLAVVAYIPSSALARTHHPAKHLTKPGRAVKKLDATPYDPALPPYSPATDDALADEALGVAPAPPPPGHHPSGLAGELAHWIAGADDNGQLPFMIVDKLGAQVFAFDAEGDFLGSAPVLVGLARGDDSAPGVGGMQLSQISADERTTPAGRFVSRWAGSEGHGTMLWVDFADAISMHPVMSVSADEHRFKRIKSSDPNDHRISYGCINVPKTFYDNVVLPALSGGDAIVYVMPDTKPIEEVFPAFAGASGMRFAADEPERRVRIAAEDRHRARHVSSADLLADEPDSIPAPEPGRFDRISDRTWMQPPM